MIGSERAAEGLVGAVRVQRSTWLRGRMEPCGHARRQGLPGAWIERVVYVML